MSRRNADRWPSRRRRAALRRLLMPSLVIAVLSVVAVGGLAIRPDEPPSASSVRHVVIAGAAGLQWEDVEREHTPNLWRLAASGAIGSLSVRSAAWPTCAADGWLTLGAGNFALDTSRPAGRACLPLRTTIETTDAAGAYLPEQEALVRDNRWQQPWGAVPGALAGAVQCTTAVGDGAAVAAARVYGRVDRFLPRLPSDPALLADQLQRCELGIVDLGNVTGTGAARQAALARVDAAFGTVQQGRPANSLLLVAGIGDTAEEPRLHVAVSDGPGLDGGFLTSDTTRRTSYVQLVDLAPTALAALGRPTPQVPMAGSPMRAVPARTGELERDLQRLVTADAEAGQAQPLRKWFLTVLVAGQLVLLASMVPLLRGHGPRRRPPRRSTAGPEAPPTLVGNQPTPDPPARWSRWASVAPGLLVAAAMATPAALVAGGLPWWREGPPGLVFGGLCLALVGAATALLTRPGIYRHTVALLGAGAGLAGLAVAVDLLSGSRLQLNGVLGYSALAGDRYAGLGDVGTGLLLAGTLLVAGCVAQQVNARWRPAVVVAVGTFGVILVGNAYLGANLGGAVALTAGVCLAGAMCTGNWLSFGRLAWATVAGVAVIGTVALLDLRRPTGERGALGRMFTELADGTAGFGLQRVSLANWEAFTETPMTLLAAGSGLFLWLVLLRPAAGLKRLFGIYPALRAGLAATALAAVLGGVLTGAALTVAAAAAAVTLPLATLAALRVRQRAVPTGRPATAAAAVSARQLLW